MDRAPVTANFGSPTVTGGTEPVATDCTPASGSAFPAGATDVICTATDAAQRKAQCVFHVTVNVVPRLQGTSFLAFGDSLTEGEVSVPFTNVLDLQPSNSYPTVLLGLLKDRYRFQSASIVMTNAGLSGEKATASEDRFLDEVLATHPEAVILLEGTNDVNDRIATSKIMTSLRANVRRAYDRGVKAVFWSTLLPEVPGRSNAANPEGIEVLNDLIRDTAAADRAILVDAWAAFDPQKELLIGTDGLHPTVQGYTKLADVFLEAIAANFQLPPPSSAAPSLFSAPTTMRSRPTRPVR